MFGSLMQLSLKYRPRSFEEVVGQNVSVRILSNSILMQRVPKAILISGLHGSGKTSISRLYAAALNCQKFEGDLCGECPSCVDVREGSHQSVIELDAASNNGVDDIRDLEKLIAQKVLHQYRVIILDEAHALSKQAQAALLKTLEESPANNVFFLVTTDPEKLEKTVRSRCLSMPLRPLHPSDVADSIRKVLQAEGVACEDAFVDTLSLYGGGSLRDIQQLLEQMIILAGTEPLSASLLEEAVGVISSERYKELASVLINKDIRYAMDEVERWHQEGADLSLLFMQGIPNLVRDFMVYLSGSLSKGIYLYSGLPKEALVRNLTLSLDDVRKINCEWEISYPMIKSGSHTKILFETYFAKVCN